MAAPGDFIERNGSGGPSLRAVMDGKHRIGKILDRIQRRPRRFPVRRMSRPRDHGDIDRAVAFLLRDLDLAQRPVLVIHALQDGDRHADIGEVVGNIPVAEFRVEPGAVPAIEGVVDVPVPARRSRCPPE